MEIIYDKRRSGKTTKLIHESHEKWMHILVSNSMQVELISNMAKKMNVDIPYPITISEIIKIKSSSDIKRGILVDEAQHILEKLIGVNIETMTITDNTEKNKVLKMLEENKNGK